MAEFSSPDLLETPELQYLRKKESFLQQFRKNALGKENEKLKELIAADILLNYLKDVIEIASDLDDDESYDMYKDTRNLILTSVPEWLRYEMIGLISSIQISGGKQVNVFFEKLEGYKKICYIHYEVEERDRVKNLEYCQIEDITENVKNTKEKVVKNVYQEMSTATFQLRKRRK